MFNARFSLVVFLSTFFLSLEDYVKVIGNCYDLRWGEVVPSLSEDNFSKPVHFRTGQITNLNGEFHITHYFGFGIIGFTNVNQTSPAKCYFNSKALTMNVLIGQNYVPTTTHYDFSVKDVSLISLQGIPNPVDVVLSPSAIHKFYESSSVAGFVLEIPVLEESMIFHLLVEYNFQGSCHAQIVLYSCSVEDMLWQVWLQARKILLVVVGLFCGVCCGSCFLAIIVFVMKLRKFRMFYLDSLEETPVRTTPERKKERHTTTTPHPNVGVLRDPRHVMVYQSLNSPASPSPIKKNNEGSDWKNGGAFSPAMGIKGK